MQKYFFKLAIRKFPVHVHAICMLVPKQVFPNILDHTQSNAERMQQLYRMQLAYWGSTCSCCTCWSWKAVSVGCATVCCVKSALSLSRNRQFLRLSRPCSMVHLPGHIHSGCCWRFARYKPACCSGLPSKSAASPRTSQWSGKCGVSWSRSKQASAKATATLHPNLYHLWHFQWQTACWSHFWGRSTAADNYQHCHWWPE